MVRAITIFRELRALDSADKSDGSISSFAKLAQNFSKEESLP